jgi:hypothetical protein
MKEMNEYTLVCNERAIQRLAINPHASAGTLSLLISATHPQMSIAKFIDFYFFERLLQGWWRSL